MTSIFNKVTQAPTQEHRLRNQTTTHTHKALKWKIRGKETWGRRIG